MDSAVFERQSPTKLFLRCAVPSVITMVFGALYQIADGLFVGRFIGGDALAAVNLVMPIIMIAFALSDMVGAGASVRISILLGEEKREEASRVFSSALKFIFIFSCVFGVAGFVFAEPLLKLIAPGASHAAVEYGITYVRMYAVFAPAMSVGFATDNFLRICGKEKLSMWIGIVSQLLNIVLDVILIAFMGQGVWAAAFTSCIAMALSSGVALFLFKGKRMDLYYTGKGVSMSVLLRVLANGSSELFGNISASVMSVVYNLFLLKYGGTTAVAAFSVIMYVDSIIGMLVFGMASSLQPPISYLYGAGRMDKVRALFRRMVLASVILSVLSMLFMMFAGKWVAPFFVKPEETELLAESIAGMKLFSLSYITGWIDMCFSSYFTSLERPARSLLTSFFGTLVFPVAFLFVLTSTWGLDGVWISAFFSCSASAVLTLIFAFTLKIDGKRIL